MTFTASDGTVFETRAAWREHEMRRFSFKQRSRESLVKRPGEIDGQGFILEDLEDCEVALCDHSDQVTADNLAGCRVLIGASSESVFLRDCRDCDFTVACKQLRTRDCTGCRIHLYSKTEPVIETSSGMAFANFNGAYAGHAEHLRRAGLPPGANLWFAVFDFNDEASTGANWSVRPPGDAEEPVWRPLDDGAPLAIPRTAPGAVAVPSAAPDASSFSFPAAGSAAGAAALPAPTAASSPPRPVPREATGAQSPPRRPGAAASAEEAAPPPADPRPASAPPSPTAARAAEAPARPPASLRALLRLASERGMDLRKWFEPEAGAGGPAFEREKRGSAGEFEPGFGGSAAPLLLGVHDFHLKLSGLGLALCAGQPDDVQRTVDGALSSSAIQQAADAARDPSGAVDVSSLLSLCGLPPGGEGAGMRPGPPPAPTPAPAAKAPEDRRRALRRLKHLSQRTMELLKAALKPGDRFRRVLLALSLDSAEAAPPVTRATLRRALREAGLEFSRVQCAAVMRHAAQSGAGEATPASLPAPLFRHFLSALRLERAIAFEAWTETKASQSKAARRGARETLKRVLEGKGCGGDAEALRRAAEELRPFEACGRGLLEAEARHEARRWLSSAAGRQEVRRRALRLEEAAPEADRRDALRSARRGALEQRAALLLASEGASAALSKALVAADVAEHAGAGRARAAPAPPFAVWAQSRAAARAEGSRRRRAWLEAKAALRRRAAAEGAKAALVREVEREVTTLAQRSAAEESATAEAAEAAGGSDAAPPFRSAHPSRRGLELNRRLAALRARASTEGVALAGESAAARKAGGLVSKESFEELFRDALRSLRADRRVSREAKGLAGEGPSGEDPGLFLPRGAAAERAAREAEEAEQEAEKDREQWLRRKEKEARRRRKERRRSDEERREAEARRRKEAKKAYRRWLRLHRRNKYYSYKNKASSDRAKAKPPAPEGKEGWVDVAPPPKRAPGRRRPQGPAAGLGDALGALGADNVEAQLERLRAEEARLRRRAAGTA